MNQTVLIGERLREERQRLDLNQTQLGEHGGVTKKTQMLYESGDRTPDAAYLAAIAEAGADIQYIVTGQRSDMALTPDERQLLALFRAAPLTGKMAAVGALQGAMGAAAGSQAAGIKAKKQEQNFHGNVGQVVKVDGDMNQPGVTFSVGGKKKK